MNLEKMMTFLKPGIISDLVLSNFVEKEQIFTGNW